MSPNQKLTVEGSMSFKEQASANTSIGDYGQLWVKNETPNDFVSGNNWLTYTSESSNYSDTFKHAKLQLNGQDRFSEREPIYFRSINPYQYHSRTPRKYIYCYSFSFLILPPPLNTVQFGATTIFGSNHMKFFIFFIFSIFHFFHFSFFRFFG